MKVYIVVDWPVNNFDGSYNIWGVFGNKEQAEAFFKEFNDWDEERPEDTFRLCILKWGVGQTIFQNPWDDDWNKDWDED